MKNGRKSTSFAGARCVCFIDGNKHEESAQQMFNLCGYTTCRPVRIQGPPSFLRALRKPTQLVPYLPGGPLGFGSLASSTPAHDFYTAQGVSPYTSGEAVISALASAIISSVTPPPACFPHPPRPCSVAHLGDVLICQQPNKVGEDRKLRHVTEHTPVQLLKERFHDAVVHLVDRKA